MRWTKSNDESAVISLLKSWSNIVPRRKSNWFRFCRWTYFSSTHRDKSGRNQREMSSLVRETRRSIVFDKNFCRQEQHCLRLIEQFSRIGSVKYVNEEQQGRGKRDDSIFTGNKVHETNWTGINFVFPIDELSEKPESLEIEEMFVVRRGIRRVEFVSFDENKYRRQTKLSSFFSSAGKFDFSSSATSKSM